VSRESQPATQTDFTSLANKAVAQNAEVVVWAGQVASNAQLFTQQLKARGFTGAFLATDGGFDSSQFKFPGAYISSFSLDINDVPVAKPFVAEFTRKYGQTISFGAPSFVAVQAMAMGISMACADGKVSRPEVRKEVGKVKMSNSLLGAPIAFDKLGDVVGGVGFTMFQIGGNGTYNVVQKG
jgi:ABC-type branched-subunit amino acid transport system substrate-binding protein